VCIFICAKKLKGCIALWQNASLGTLGTQEKGSKNCSNYIGKGPLKSKKNAQLFGTGGAKHPQLLKLVGTLD